MAATPRLRAEQIAQISGLASGYISSQRAKYNPRAIPLSPKQTAAMGGFFSPQLLDGTDYSAMAAITLCDTVVSHEPISNGVLFHELVHVEQYRQLGIPRFAELYCADFSLAAATRRFRWKQMRTCWRRGGRRIQTAYSPLRRK